MWSVLMWSSQADLMGAQFGLNRAGVVEQLSPDCGIADGKDAHLARA
jgi:hypothetical protein